MVVLADAAVATDTNANPRPAIPALSAAPIANTDRRPMCDLTQTQEDRKFTREVVR